MSNTIKTVLNKAYTILKATSPSPRIDAEILLSWLIEVTRTYLYTHPEALLTPIQNQQYQQMIQQRQQGHPIAHIIGSKEFWSLPLCVTPDTLIPRPETELLVELTLTLLESITQAHILDLGTGTGAIALALASERPSWHIQAVDKSEAALLIAQKNAKQLNLPQVSFIHSHWFNAVPKHRFQAIVTNPPYIAEQDPHLYEGDVRFEPLNALTSGPEGIDDITEIIKTSLDYLVPGGFLIIEHGFDQKNTITNLFNQYGYVNVQNFKDWQGLDRVTVGYSEVL